jgi:hypothetical protein
VLGPLQNSRVARNPRTVAVSRRFLRRIHHLQVERQVGRWRNRDVIKAFQSLSRVFYSKQAGEPERLDAVVVVAHAKAVVVA